MQASAHLRHAHCSNRYAPLALDLERVEDLLVPLAIRARYDGPRHFEQPIRQGTLAMVDMGNDGKVSYPLGGKVGK